MGGGGGTMSARGAATALGKMTWGLAVAFICTSIWLTVIAAQNTSDSSVLDRLGTQGAPVNDGDQSPSVPELGGDLLPPSSAEQDPSLPPRAD